MKLSTHPGEVASCSREIIFMQFGLLRNLIDSDIVPKEVRKLHQPVPACSSIAIQTLFSTNYSLLILLDSVQKLFTRFACYSQGWFPGFLNGGNVGCPLKAFHSGCSQPRTEGLPFQCPRQCQGKCLTRLLKAPCEIPHVHPFSNSIFRDADVKIPNNETCIMVETEHHSIQFLPKSWVNTESQICGIERKLQLHSRKPTRDGEKGFPVMV